MQLTRAKSELLSEMRTKCELFDGKSSHADQSSQCELKGHLWVSFESASGAHHFGDMEIMIAVIVTFHDLDV